MRDKYLFVPENIALDSPYTAIQIQIIEYFKEQKIARKAAANAAAQKQQLALQKMQPHPVLHAYEKEHLAVGTKTIGDVKSEIFIYLKKKLPNAPPVEFTVATRGVGVGSRTGTDPLTIVGKILEDDDRFVQADPQPPDLVNQVYVKEGDLGRHYVKLNDGSFLRRFVTRGLNQCDSFNLQNNDSLTAPQLSANAVSGDIIKPKGGIKRHGVALNAPLTEKQQILSHTRGWAKRFVSTTTTKRDVYSSRGTQFRSVFGAAFIDLAKVPLDTVFDLHRPDRLGAFDLDAQAIVDATKPQPKTVNNPLSDERFLAARDVIRTREVLVRGSVPFAAVVTGSFDQRVLGIAGATDDETGWGESVARGAGRVVVQGETLGYQCWGARWTFLEFNSSIDAEAAADYVLLEATKWRMSQKFSVCLLRKYELPSPAPIGF